MCYLVPGATCATRHCDGFIASQMAGDSAPKPYLNLLLSWITSGTYCHTLDFSEADAKVKSGAHDVSQGSSPVSGRGYEQDWTEGLAEL